MIRFAQKLCKCRNRSAVGKKKRRRVIRVTDKWKRKTNFENADKNSVPQSFTKELSAIAFPRGEEQRHEEHLRGRKKVTRLVPLRRTIEVNLDGLFGIGDVVPVPIRFPAVGDDLDQDAAETNVGNVRNALLIGFDV